MVDFNLSEDQEAFRATASRFFAEQYPLTEVRRVGESPEGYSRELWRSMSDLDWAGLGIAVEHGGVGRGLVDLCILYHEIGRSLAVTPHLPSAVVAANILAQGGAGAQSLLPDIAAGNRIVVPALFEEDGLHELDSIELRMTVDGDQLRVAGTKLLVPFAADASHFIVAGRLGEGPGITVALVDATSAGIEVTPLPNLAMLPLSAVTFDVVVAQDSIIGAIGGGADVLQPALDQGRVLRAAEIAGAGERMMELAVDYAKTRVQFGNPIGKYQAVQYLCTDLAIGVQLSQLLAISTAGRADEGLGIELAAARAKAYASGAARRMAVATHEVFAGIAFMKESDIHFFSRHLKYLELDLGDEHYQLRTCGALVSA